MCVIVEAVAYLKFPQRSDIPSAPTTSPGVAVDVIYVDLDAEGDCYL